MAKYNFYISYSHRDGEEYASVVVRQLQKKGYKVFTDKSSLPDSNNWAVEILEAISNSDCFIPIITDQYLQSAWAMEELQLAISESKNRSKPVIPLVFCEAPLPSGICHHMENRISYRIDSAPQIRSVIDQIHRTWGYKYKSEALYERLAVYNESRYYNKSAAVVCQLFAMLLDQWTDADGGQRRALCREMCRLYQPLLDYVGSYDEESRKTAHEIMDTLQRVENLWKDGDTAFHHDPFFAAFAVRALHAHRAIWLECVDVLSNGDVHNPTPAQEHRHKQDPFLQLLTQPQRWWQYGNLSQEDAVFVAESSQFLLSQEEQFAPKPKDLSFSAPKRSENDEILLSVAKYLQESNRLFDTLQKNGMSGEFLKCLMTGYERVKNYCEVVGASDVAADCVDRILELRTLIDKQDEGDCDEKVKNGIKSLLGLTIQGSGRYDLFISFKHEDADLAESIYKYCQRHMKVPFWSKRTLPELSKSEYEDAIFGALRNAKHFVVVLSKLEYLNANWIKKEMSTFDRGITEGRKPGGNFVFVVTDDVYQQIIACNKECLDDRYCGYQIIKMSEYEESLLPYLS